MQSRCFVVLATASLLPLRIGLAKVYCGKEQFWKEEGHSTIPTVIEGNGSCKRAIKIYA